MHYITKTPRETRILMTCCAAILAAALVASTTLPLTAAAQTSALKNSDPLGAQQRLGLEIESNVHQEIERKFEIVWDGKEPVDDGVPESDVQERDAPASVQRDAEPAPDAASSLALSTGPSLGPNLVPNPNLELSGAAGLPTSWFKGGYGNNTRVLTYPVTGVSGSKAAQVVITNYVSGDAKWYSSDIPVKSGAIYQFSDFVKSTAPSIVTMRFKKTDGSFMYTDILTTGAQANFTQVSAMFTVPSGVEALSIFHLIKQNGTLATDNYSLNEVIDDTGGGDNLMPNADLEIDGGAGTPVSWFKGGYGNNSRTFAYPVSGVGGSKAAQVTLANYVSGDAKWYHEPVAVTAGMTYTFSDAYKSTAPSIITAQFEKSSGGFSYLDLTSLPAAASFQTATVDFSVPVGIVAVRIFHLIKQNGTLTIDNTSLTEKGPPSGVFANGAISLTFDDAWDAHYNTVVPKLNSEGLHGTFYIVSERFQEDGFPAFMTKAQVQDIRSDGHEIGSHTKTHRALTTLSSSEQLAEIEGSKADLEGLGLGPITTLAYPFGDYNASVLTMVKDASYDAARSTIDGTITPSSDRYQLARFSVENDTTLADVEDAVEAALLNHEWLIFAIHRVDYSNEQYSTTPETFAAIVEYIASLDVMVPTVAEGVASI